MILKMKSNRMLGEQLWKIWCFQIQKWWELCLHDWNSCTTRLSKMAAEL